MSAPSAFYVYAHKRQSDGRLFYIGKGKDRRAWEQYNRNPHWRHVAAKHGVEVEIVRDGMPEGCAFTFERICIAANRDKGLANIVEGGGGTAGWKHTEETRAKISARFKGRGVTPAMREALRRWNERRVTTEETRRKMSEAAKARPRRAHSEETRAKIAAAHVGIRPSAETLRKMSAAKIGKAVGKDSPSYDHTIRHWRNDDGREFIGTRGDFIKEYGLKDGCVCTVIKGRQKSVKSWRLV
jgi:hypothetical protein